MTQRGRIVALSISVKKGMKKTNVDRVRLLRGKGVEKDAHAEGGLRQVSLLMDESIRRMQDRGVSVGYGDFAENIVTSGIDLGSVTLSDRITIGDSVELKVTKIGKECPSPCSIYRQVGYCIMPEEGIFCSVEEPGLVDVGDVVVLECRTREGERSEAKRGRFSSPTDTE